MWPNLWCFKWKKTLELYVYYQRVRSQNTSNVGWTAHCRFSYLFGQKLLYEVFQSDSRFYKGWDLEMSDPNKKKIVVGEEKRGTL